MKNIIGLILIGFVMIGCDPAIGYEYYLNNQSDSILVVKFRGNESNRTNDSIIEIMPKSEKLFYDTSMWGENPHDEKDDFLNIFDTIEVMNKSMISIKKNIYKRKNWTYDNEITHNGLKRTGTNIYRLKLTNDDLQK